MIGADGLYSRLAIRQKLEKVEPSECRSVLILFSYVASQDIAGNMKSALSEGLF